MDEQFDLDKPQGTPRFKIISRNAGVFAMLLIIMLLMTHIFRETMMEKNTLISWVEYGLLLIAIIITQLQVRENSYNGIMPFGSAFNTGLIFTLLVAAIYSVFTLIFFIAIGPELLQDMRTIAENSLREKGMSDEEVQAGMKFVNMSFTPVGMFIMVLFGFSFFGVILTLIASLFTGRTR